MPIFLLWKMKFTIFLIYLKALSKFLFAASTGDSYGSLSEGYRSKYPKFTMLTGYTLWSIARYLWLSECWWSHRQRFFCLRHIARHRIEKMSFGNQYESKIYAITILRIVYVFSSIASFMVNDMMRRHNARVREKKTLEFHTINTSQLIYLC